MLGGKLGGTVTDRFNVFMNYDKDHSKQFDIATGRPSKLNLSINWSQPDRILNVPTNHIGLCIIHGIARNVEHLLEGNGTGTSSVSMITPILIMTYRIKGRGMGCALSMVNNTLEIDKF